MTWLQPDNSNGVASAAAQRPEGTTTNVYSEIETLASVVPGWTPPEQLLTLYNLVLASGHLGGDVLEIGSWCGRSTAILAKALAACGSGTVHAVDLFPHKNDWRRNADGSYSFESRIGDKTFGAYTAQTVWAEPFERDIAPVYEKYDSVRDAFDETLERAGVEEFVKAYHGNSQVFAAQAPKGTRCRLAFIDGDHGYEAICQDIKIVERFLLPGGWICFDDAFTVYDGVNSAIRDCVITSKSYALDHQLTQKMFVARYEG